MIPVFTSRARIFLVLAVLVLLVGGLYALTGQQTEQTEAQRKLSSVPPPPAQATISIEKEEESVKPVLLETGADTALPLIKIEPDEIKDEAYLNRVQRYAFRPQWIKNAVTVDVQEGKPTITIIIDDIGVNRKLSKDVIQLPRPLTLAFLPYAPGVDSMASEARAAGHELIVHMPMEPTDPDVDTGPIVLRSDQTSFVFEQMLEKGLSAFDGYVGINNHMGSRLTQDTERMEHLMAVLNNRGLLFVDSRTIHSSVAAEAAELFDVPYAVRDVFIDHKSGLEDIKASLARLESIAKETGSAIGIGHPRENTLTALEEWLPAVEERGFTLVPVSHVVKTRPDGAYSSVRSQSSDPLRQ